MPRYPRQDDPKGKKVIPSVTEIISDCTDNSGPLTQWSANCCKLWIQENCPKPPRGNYLSGDDYAVSEEDLDEMRFNFRKVSKKALDIGSEVHGLIEDYLTFTMKNEGREWKLPGGLCRETGNAFHAFWEWSVDHDLQPIALEKTVYGDGWAGTLDIDCYLDNVRTIIDIKTSKDFYWDSMGPQIVAYSSTYDPVPEMGILRLDKETGMPFYRSRTKYFERDLAIFNHMVEIYFLRHPRIAKQARGE